MMYNRNNFNNQRNPYNNSNYQSNEKDTPDNNHNNHMKTSFESNPKLRGIDPLKLKIIMEIKNKSKNRSMEELLPEIMKINQELNRRNMAFTKPETELLLEVIEEGLSPEEKARFNMLKGFMNM
ncbi:MAG: hypothetical protein J6J16_00060 [Lachnospiraceae bacterium]|nr:hypothetical protein [Lachnospiraceae bacterium]